MKAIADVSILYQPSGMRALPQASQSITLPVSHTKACVIRVLIADNHVLIQEGIKSIVLGQKDIEIAGVCSTATEVLEFLRRNICDVLILGNYLPDKSVLDVVLDLKKLAPKTKILIQSIMPEEHFALQALKMGASGYISNDMTADELLTAIRKVHVGRRHVSPNMTDILLLNLEGEKSAPHERLSDREFQVLQLIGSGKSTGEIAHVLCLSIHTVSTYRKRILFKTGMHHTAQLIQYALKNHLAS